MLQIKEIRKNPEFFINGLKKRNVENVQQIIKNLLEIDSEYRKKIDHSQTLLEKRNSISKKIPTLDKNDKSIKSLTDEVSKIKKENLDLENDINLLKNKIDNILSSLPNLPADDVPVGLDSSSNIEVKKIGTIKKLKNILSHDEISKKFMDFETAVKISGSRFVILKSDLSLLERALTNFMLDVHVKEHGYQEYSVPVIVNEKSMYGTGQLPKFENEQFKLNNNFWLIPTSEVSLTNTVSDQILDYQQLPIRITSATQCFRAEAGAAGKDTKGMIRQHQFTKVELVSIIQPEFRFKELDRLLNCAESILKKLDLPYRVMILSSGDMGFSAEKTFDIEVWLPSQNKYREISSCSSCGTFQALRMKSRYKTLDGKNEYVATLNGSGLAVGRTLVSILENYQNEDRSITIPSVLRSYMHNKEKIILK